jgi:hypothetical protein
MIRWRRMEIGWMSEVMAVAGNRRLWSSIAAGRRISTAVAGFIRIAAGIGCRIIHGVGRRSIMGAGSSTRRSAGAGDLTGPGDRHGFAGGTTAIIVAGRRCRRAQGLLPASASHSAVILQGTISRLG